MSSSSVTRDGEKVLAVDLDETLAGYYAGLRAWMLSQGRPVPAGEPTSYDLVSCGWFTSETEFGATHAAAVADGMLARLPVKPGASQMLWSLVRAGVRVEILTARLLGAGLHARAISDTVEWLDRNQIPYSSLHVSGVKERVLADVYLDDSPRMIERLRAHGRTVVIADHPTNRHLPGPRVRDLRDPQALLDALGVNRALVSA